MFILDGRTLFDKASAGSTEMIIMPPGVSEQTETWTEKPYTVEYTRFISY